MTKASDDIQPRGLTVRQAARYWGCSVPYFRTLEKAGIVKPLPRLTRGKMFFDIRDLDAVMDAQRRVA